MIETPLPTLLSVDTSSAFGVVALSIRGEYVGEVALQSSESHSARLLPSIEFLLHSAGLEISEMDGFGCVDSITEFIFPHTNLIDFYLPRYLCYNTDYEIINNKTGQVVGTASWTTNDYFGPGALKITMKNGATRWLDIYPSEKGNPQTASNRFVKDPKTSKKYKDQGVAEGENIGGERYDKIADLKGRTVDELNKLIQKLEGIVANYPDHPRTNEYLGLAKMIRAQKIGKKGVAEGSDNSVEALIQVYNNRDQKIVKTKVFRSEDEANRWADRNNATILKLKDVAKKSTIDETTAGSIAGVVNPKIKNKSKVGTLFGGTYRQQKDK